MFSFVQSEAEYLSARKLSLVNGMHTVLAFMTLGQNYVFPENVPDEDRSKQEVRATVTTRRIQNRAEGGFGLTLGKLLSLNLSG